MLGFNLFTTERFVETTTILWLRILSFVSVLVGVYILYAGSNKQSPSTILIIIGVILMVVGLGSLFTYLIAGSLFAGTNACSYCPKTPVRLLISGNRGILPSPAPLPDKDPFRHTAVYYVLLDNLEPTSSSSNPTSKTLIYRPGLYRIIVDGNTGNLGILPEPVNTEGNTLTFFGTLPTQTLCQLAVIHEEKEIRVFVNGIPKGSVVRTNLPPTSSIQSSFLFNPNGIVQSGMMYQVEIHDGNLTTEQLMSMYERISIQYDNDSTYQNTRFPTDTKRTAMSFADTFLGIIRLIGETFGYTSGISLAIHNTKTLGVNR